MNQKVADSRTIVSSNVTNMYVREIRIRMLYGLTLSVVHQLGVFEGRRSNRHLTCPYYAIVNLSGANASKGPQYTDGSDDCSDNHMDCFVAIEPRDTNTKREQFHYANSAKEDEDENDNQELMGEHGRPEC